MTNKKIRERKQEGKKKIRSLKAVEKFLLINNKVPKVLDAQVEYRIYSNKRPTSNWRPPRISAHPHPTPSHTNSNKR